MTQHRIPFDTEVIQDNAFAMEDVNKGIVRTQRVAHTHLLYPHFIPQQELVAQMGPYRDQSSEEWDPGQTAAARLPQSPDFQHR